MSYITSKSRIFYFYPESKKEFLLHRLSLDKLYLEPLNTEKTLYGLYYSNIYKLLLHYFLKQIIKIQLI